MLNIVVYFTPYTDHFTIAFLQVLLSLIKKSWQVYHNTISCGTEQEKDLSNHNSRSKVNIRSQTIKSQ